MSFQAWNYFFVFLIFDILTNSKSEIYHTEIIMESQNSSTIIHYLPRGNHSESKKRSLDHSTVQFLYYKNGKKTYESSETSPNELKYTGCSSLDKFAFILHGWKQNCDTEWVQQLIDRLTHHRGGCIICVDFGSMAMSSYMTLYRNYQKILDSFYQQILALISNGFDPDKGYIFGFSFGGQLATAVGTKLRPLHLIRSIDTCDMAGPGFDFISTLDHRKSAKYVQCLHSSQDKGTQFYSCHLNVRLGKCGISQPAFISQNLYSSHGLCMQVYINAFDFPFYVSQKFGQRCSSKSANVPEGFTIGYNENPLHGVQGQVFVPTGLNFPYNLSKRELKAIESFV